MISTHSQRLERWLGDEHLTQLSNAMTSWYGPPIPVGGVPGNVWATKGGDFRGQIDAGQFACWRDFVESRAKRIAREFTRRQERTCNTGFTSLSDLISEATAGKIQSMYFTKTGPTKVIAAASSLWQQGAQPAAGAVSGAAPGGTVPTKASTGALYFANPATTTDSMHFVGATVVGTLANTLLLYDRLFGVAKTINSTASETVNGVPTRYTSVTSGAADWIGGNFLYVAATSIQLAATAHNWVNTTYKDQSGTTGTALPTLAGISGCIVQRLDMPLGTWFAPLAAGDVGITNLEVMQCSALVATGAVDFVLGHPIAWMPVPIANMGCMVDGINTAFNLNRIYQDACLAFLEVSPPAAGATTYNGSVTMCAG